MVIINNFTSDELKTIERLLQDEVKSIEKMNLFSSEPYKNLLTKVQRMNGTYRPEVRIDWDKFKLDKE
jgi:hypothetical protein